MARGDVLNARLLERIATSELSLTVQYPAARATASGSSPGPAPVNPLTGTNPAPTVFPAAVTPAKPAVTLKCLWLDVTTQIPAPLNKEARVIEAVGWIDGLQAVARVAVSDAAIDATDPLGDTVFTDCLKVVFQGHDYKVLTVKPLSASFRMPVTYYVGLTSA